MIFYLCNEMKRVVVGLSGGVDSSVAAFLLKQQGYDVIGIFMRNWHDERVTISDECPWIDDSNDALLIAQQLDIPFQVIDLSNDYKNRIVDYMFREYEVGRTPNPDVLCNREIKFDVFLNAAIALGADYVATGHYCRRMHHSDESFGLFSGIDSTKDQSYFLCQLNQFQLSKALFPIGNLLKSEVREIARTEGLLTADKKDSQGLCFVGKIRLPQFLQQQLAPKKGPVIEIPSDNPQLVTYHSIPPNISAIEKLSDPFRFQPADGLVVAEHQGAHYYTVGQRKGLHIGGRPEASFVLATDTTNNYVFSGLNDSHPGLNRWALRILPEDIHWVSPSYKIEMNETINCQVRVRYRQQLQNATLVIKNSGAYILFKEKQRGITPGQFAAWYINNELIGSGVIHS
jgi:tRNA-specific 2-thiouridylase